jgi:uncharacterized protein YfaS (alpha-2-macroglobulin family)
LYVNQLLDLTKEKQAVADKNVQATIDQLKQFQTTNGGFGYWQGDDEASNWGTTYAGHFILEAQKRGFALPPAMLDKWKNYQRKVAKTWVGSADFYNTDLDQAYRLYTLALADAPEWGSMNRLKERPKLSTAAKWRLAAAYAVAGKPEVAKKLVQKANPIVKPYMELGYTYGSDVRDRAMILETMVLMGQKTEGLNTLKFIAGELSSDKWFSTQTVAYALLAVAKYVGEETQKQFTFTYTLGGKAVTSGTDKPLFQTEFNPEKVRKATVKNTSKGVLFARVILKGQPSTDDKTDSESNLKLTIAYKDLFGKTIDPTQLKQGTDFLAEVTVTNPGTMGNYLEMALSQVFPSGWEIHNARMNNLQTYSNTSIPEFQDIRDDRVYTYFDLSSGNTSIYRIQLNAAYQGRFYLPTLYCEAMYNNSISARQAGKWVSVVPQTDVVN